MTLLFCCTTVIFCVVGDALLRYSSTLPLWLRAAGDSVTHGLVGSASWAAVIVKGTNIWSTTTWTKVLLAGVVASSIDLDHFLEAKSLSLKVSIQVCC